IINVNDESENHLNIIYYLTACGSDINTPEGELLKDALLNNDKTLVNFLLDLGAKSDISASNGYLSGKTALMILLSGDAYKLSEEDQETIFEKLWRNVEDVNVTDEEG